LSLLRDMIRLAAEDTRRASHAVLHPLATVLPARDLARKAWAASHALEMILELDPGRIFNASDAMNHQFYGGDHCVWNPDGACTACGVTRETCDTCGGTGYHRTPCPHAEAPYYGIPPDTSDDIIVEEVTEGEDDCNNPDAWPDHPDAEVTE